MAIFANVKMNNAKLYVFTILNIYINSFFVEENDQRQGKIKSTWIYLLTGTKISNQIQQMLKHFATTLRPVTPTEC